MTQTQVEVKTIMTEVPRSPKEIGKITPKSPSLKELNEMLATWLAQAYEDEKIDKLFMIGQQLAEAGEVYPYTAGRQQPKRFNVGDFTLHYFTITTVSGGFVALWGKFEQIVVTIGGKKGFELIDGQQVAKIFMGDSYTPGLTRKLNGDPQAVKERKAKNFYIPGPDWEGAIMQFYGEARRVKDQERIDQYDGQRDQVLKKMGVTT